MKTLSESLFDDDLVSKEVSLEFDDTYNILKKEFEKLNKKCEKKDWVLSFSRMGVYVQKTFPFIDEDNSNNFVNIRFSISFYKDSNKFYISIPDCTCRFTFSYSYDRTETFSDAVCRWILKKYNELKISDYTYMLKTIEINSNNIFIIIEMITNMIERLISKDMDKKINKYIDQYCKRKDLIPGIVLDQGIMKQLIK